MRNHNTLLLGLIALLSTASAWSTTAELADGSIVGWGSPGSQVYLIGTDGSRTPLWNGVHRLHNGAQLTIRNGVLSGEPWSADGVHRHEGRCRQLIDRVCGDNGSCSNRIACRIARQIADMEIEAGAAATAPGMASQCEYALRDQAYFRPCR